MHFPLAASVFSNTKLNGLMQMISVVTKRYQLPGLDVSNVARRVVPRHSLGRLSDAEQVLTAAQVERESILDEARRVAREVELAAEEDARRKVWQAASACLKQLAESHESFLREAESMLAHVAQAALRRLLLDVPPDWPLLSSVRLVLREWEGSPEAELRVRPDALDAIKSHLGNVTQLDIVADESMQAGNCVLICAQGELRASYSASVDSLIEAMRASNDPSTV
jgi:type III secretion system HrpE/YscL family protein